MISDGTSRSLPLTRRALLGTAGALSFGAALPARLLAADDPDAGIRAAFYYAFTLYEFARNEQALARCVGAPGTLNTIVRRSQLSDWRSRNVTAPNNDTIYSSCLLDLSGGPMELAAPTVRDRYLSIAFMNAFTDNFAYVGTRATNGKDRKSVV